MVGGLLKAQLRHLANENLGEVPKLRTKGVTPTSRYPFRRIANGCPPIGLQITACSEHEVGRLQSEAEDRDVCLGAQLEQGQRRQNRRKAPVARMSEAQVEIAARGMKNHCSVC